MVFENLWPLSNVDTATDPSSIFKAEACSEALYFQTSSVFLVLF